MEYATFLYVTYSPPRLFPFWWPRAAYMSCLDFDSHRLHGEADCVTTSNNTVDRYEVNTASGQQD